MYITRLGPVSSCTDTGIILQYARKSNTSVAKLTEN